MYIARHISHLAITYRVIAVWRVKYPGSPIIDLYNELAGGPLRLDWLSGI